MIPPELESIFHPYSVLLKAPFACGSNETKEETTNPLTHQRDQPASLTYIFNIATNTPANAFEQIH